MGTVNEKELAQVVEIVLQQVRGSKRWQNAITRAAELIRSDALMHWTGSSLLILSDSGEVYEANAVCQCKAFLRGQPCKHRAAYKLVKRLNEIAQ